MKVLNLVNKETSEIKYEVSKFPDGQSQVKIVAELHDFIWVQAIQIKARLNNFQDLELIMCAVASLRGLGVSNIHLYVPYILGARSDRKFEEGSNNYLKTIICPLINRIRFNSVTVLDPHSDCLEMGISNYRKQTNKELVKFALSDLYGPNASDNFLLMSPDAGASKKIYKLAEEIGYKGDIITCSKDRDTKGKLTKVVIPLFVEPAKKDIIIIDDICDGGATFINIAKALKDTCHNNKVYLIVTHGIFSKGFSELEQHFESIYCTNSYSNTDDITVEFGDPSSIRQAKFINKRVKQLNVF